MKQDNVIIAPQSGDVQKAYDVWRATHKGSMAAFYRFLTTPSIARSLYVAKLPEATIKIIGEASGKFI